MQDALKASGRIGIIELRTQADHRRPKITVYTRYGKRVLDLAIALSTSLVLLPLFLLAAILVRVGSPGPLFFRQERLGQNGRLFILYKSSDHDP